MPSAPDVLVVDNYDSFVYNLVQYLGELGASTKVLRNDHVTAQDLQPGSYRGVLVSPGPGHPASAGNSVAIIRECGEQGVSMLGVCLGHQALGVAYGATVLSAPELVHGRSSLVHHSGQGVFRGMPDPFVAGRYHSLVVDEGSLPDCFEVTATSGRLIMGMRHRELSLEGVQFHPESVLTQDGYLILANWLATCGIEVDASKVAHLNERSTEVRGALPVPTS